ncbi:MAG: TonB family protein [Acidobacteria bacterium]|nr:TonB family protein [Acidobacteriota bacterium]
MARLRRVASFTGITALLLLRTAGAVQTWPLQAESPAAAPAVGHVAQPGIPTDQPRPTPAAILKAPVVFPAVAAGPGGPVILHVRTDAAGTPTGVEAVGGEVELAEAAVSALWAWRFEPDAEAREFLIALNVRPSAPDPFSDAPAARVGGDVTPPTKIVHVSPVYPPEARERGIQGVVVLEVRIGRDGHTTEGRVLRPVDWRLDAAALDAALRWQFAPTFVEGSARPVVMTVTVNFTLQ